MKHKVQYRVKEECGLFYIEMTTDNFKTCSSVAVSPTREEAEERMREKRYSRK